MTSSVFVKHTLEAAGTAAGSAADTLPAPDSLTRRQNWTRHWASGAAHSCTGSFGETYGGALATFWSRVFRGLPPGAQLLDIATGNGAVPRLLMRERELASGISCHAIDLADVAPAWAGSLDGGQRPRLQFHGGVSADQLPFENSRFDGVSSQYGIEYANLDLAMAEALRVLKPGGLLALVLHHADSRPVSLAQWEVEHLDWLLGEDGLLPCAHELLEPLERARSPEGRAALESDPAAAAVRERFNAAQDRLAERAQQRADGADVLFEARQAVSQVIQTLFQRDRQAAQAQLQALSVAFEDTRFRLQELRRCALSAEGLSHHVQRLLLQGFHVECGPLHEQGHLMGWQLRAQR
ncbi:MAG: class I SAM-dependent methyltransferase [Rubrivivax sp.]|nr:class I SAM-dependent methyltransferase [Rubrivivax sp.]